MHLYTRICNCVSNQSHKCYKQIYHMCTLVSVTCIQQQQSGAMKHIYKVNKM